MRPLRRLTSAVSFTLAAAGVAAVAIGLFLAPTSAQAANTPAPGFQISGYFTEPDLAPGGEGTLILDLYGIGAQQNTEPIILTNTLPPGLTMAHPPGGNCEAPSPTVLSCEIPAGEIPYEPAPGVPVEFGVDPFPIPVQVKVEADPPASPQLDRAELSGGGALGNAATSVPVSYASVAPQFGFANFTSWLSDPDGTIDTQAGSHPYAITVAFNLNEVTLGPSREAPAGGEIAGLEIKTPPGLIGNPNAVPQCTHPQFVAGQCPASSTIGQNGTHVGGLGYISTYVFNLIPPRGDAAQFGFTYEGVTVYLDAHVRSDGDYGVSERIVPVSQNNVLGNTTEIWGVPAEHPSNHPNEYTNAPFLTLPTSCQGPQSFEAVALGTWQHPEVRSTATALSHDAEGTPVGYDGCNQLKFEPTIQAKPTTDLADSPTGLDFDLHLPQKEGENPDGLAEANLKDATVTLPKGLVVDPSSANGLEACSPAQIGMKTAVGQTPAHFSNEAAQCPEAAKLGSVEVDTPLVDHPLLGGVYLAQQGQNPFGSLLAIYLVIEDPQTGTIVKLPGKVSADPTSGQLTATVAENPQIPFEDLHLDFSAGAHASLQTPATCGSFQTSSDLTPWSSPEGADATPSDSFAITGPPSGAGACPTSEAAAPDSFALSAGTANPIAGAYSPFLLKVSREDGSQRLGAIDATLPPGMSGRLAGVPYCSEAEIAQAQARSKPGEGALEQSHPSCPAASEVGVANVGAGAGPTPFYVQGHAYLAGPYKGAPLSMVIITPALAGPFDLGTVVVRTALYVNDETAQITAKSDPLPSILQGIPLDIRSVAVELQRPGFTLNPTSCEPSAVTATLTSTLGQSTSPSSPFQVGECRKLAFKPKLALSLKGATKRNHNPALKAVLTYPSKGAYANIAKAQVTLPHSEFLDQAHIKTICTRVQFAEGNVPGERCPAASIYGFARATTPLLDKPLEGPVYLRSSSHNLPDLVAALGGQIDVALDGRIDTGKGGGIRNTFEAVPDAPVSKFTLELQGGAKKGLLVNSEDICRKPQRAIADFTAQNGKVSDTDPLIANSCGGGGKKKHGAKDLGHAHR